MPLGLKIGVSITGGSRPTAFSPLSLSPSFAYLSGLGQYQERTGASATTPAVADSDPIGTWLDQSTNAQHLTAAADATRPLQKLAVQNGLAAALLDGLDDYLVTASIALLSAWSATGSTVFAVLKRDSTGAADQLFEHQSASGNAARLWAPFSDNVMYYDHGDSAGGGRISQTKPAGYANAFHIVEAYRDGANMEILVDGTSLVSTGAAASNLVAGSGLFFVGTNTSLAAGFFKGYIGDFLGYSTGLSAGNRALVRAYLKSRWGTP